MCKAQAVFGILAQLVGGIFAAPPALLHAALILCTSVLEATLRTFGVGFAKDVSFLKRQLIRRVKAGTISAEASAHRLEIENLKLQIECEVILHRKNGGGYARKSHKENSSIQRSVQFYKPTKQ